MNKQETLLTLEQFKQQVENNENEPITLYYRNNTVNDLRWCNGVNDTIDEVNKLDENLSMALEFETFECFIEEFNKPRFAEDEE